MNTRLVFKSLGFILVFIGVAMVFPLVVSLYYGEGDAGAILVGITSCLVGGLFFALAFRRARGDFKNRDAFLLVTLTWVAAAAMGAIPFRVSGYFGTYLDAFFEMMSGFTNTGATVLPVIEKVPHGLVFWRSFAQWLGGVGIIVLYIAILPFLGTGGMQLFRAESPGPTVDKLKPRIAETAKLLWGIYVGLTLLEITLLKIGGMNLFDATCNSFSCMATGGFSPRTASIAYYNSAYIDGVITFFMLVASINFSLHYQALRGKPIAYARNAEFRWYVGIYVLSCAIIMWNTRHIYHTMGQSLRYVSFQVASIYSTTGFATYDFAKWPAASQFILLLLMLLGGSACSTAGGLKVVRLGILLKVAHREIVKLIHPNAVITIKIDGNPVQTDVLDSILGFFSFYIMIVILSTLAMNLVGLDIVSAISSVAACMGTIGPGLGAVGPTANYAGIPALGKVVLAFCMLVGRLEIYTVLVVLSPVFWRR
ncbi:MAG TPA: TrkH family potassium uptake protein [Deltaproteobacteria bacterium]|nr:TrkH family potassium uptake protein [Deltaproteobacteria bacterium]